ncbi:hypothetical protein [Paraburkholderia sp.]|uniref:hypothetical protein n=1 Tax=Paraburkholderia sp. TaxID=1926495 RepID=UPI003C7B17F7
MIESVLKTILAGEFICSVRYPSEYAALDGLALRERVESALQDLGNRIARTNEDDGAYFMAPRDISTVATAKLKEELRRFRDVYGPAVLLLDMIRQANAGEISLSPGEYIRLSTMEGLVIESASLESHLNSLSSTIKGFNQRNSIRENLRRVFEQLRDEGYVILANPTADTYQITGKIEYLYSIIEYISENEMVMAERVDDEVTEDQQTIEGVVDV